MKKNGFFIAIAMLISSVSFSQEATRVKQFNLAKSGLAIEGYDPVAYFTQKKAVKGKSNLGSTYEGVIYYFSSQVNKDAFVKNPTTYEPQYGGWCSYAMGANGEKVEVDPETFKIVDGKLNLYYNAYFNNTLKSWNKEETNLKKKADINWKKFIN